MMLHPATLHFAMVLPLVALVFGLIYLMNRSEHASKVSTRLTVIAAIAMGVAWYTGNQAGPVIYDYLSEAGQKTLIDHKTIGLYLAVAMGVIALIKLIGCKMRNFIIEAFAIVLLLGATAVTLAQGKLGGEIVYNHGMPFKAYMIEDSLKEAAQTAEAEDECDAQLEAFTDAMDDIQMVSEEVNAMYGVAPKVQEESEEE